MKVMSSFINRHGPNRLALTARTSTIGTKLIWANENTSGWPLDVDGFMSQSMAPVLGYLVLDQCWVGEFEEFDGEYWVACGLTDQSRHWGHVVASFDQPVDQMMVNEVRILTIRFEELILRKP